MRLYRALLHLYPRSFRREYGDDMVALVASQRRHESRFRVAARTSVDLATTIPMRHLEARMPRSSTTVAIIGLAAIAIVFAVVGGPLALVVPLAAFALAVTLFRRSRPMVPADGRWWRLLLAGAGMLASIAVITTITGQLPDGWWFVAMTGLLTSFLLIAAGIVLGIAGRIRPTT